MRCQWAVAIGRSIKTIVFCVMVFGVAGCDTFLAANRPTGPGADDPVPPARTSACARAPAVDKATTLVVLDWTGGESRHAPDRTLIAFDFNTLNVSDSPAKSQARDLGTFEQDVLARVQTILCALDPMDVAVIMGESTDYPEATVVHITGDEPGHDATHVGQSDFDICNQYPDDRAVIWGGALASRIPSATYDQWINAFANTTAHEIGHTLGFFHPDPEMLARALPIPSEEIMRAATSTSELLEQKYFLVQQDTCPGDDSDALSYKLLDGADGHYEPSRQAEAKLAENAADGSPSTILQSLDDAPLCAEAH